MDTHVKEKPVADLRDYLAEERTFLAWIRTGIALMGFGFLVTRFGSFGAEPQVTQHVFTAHAQDLSLWVGATLIATGVIVNLLSARRYMRLIGALNRGQFVHRSLSTLGLMVALLLALLGIAMAIYAIPVLA
jgi:inner membrane protein YidH